MTGLPDPQNGSPKLFVCDGEYLVQQPPSGSIA